MTKLEFLIRLKDRLNGLPENEKEERVNFYAEIIDDKIEDGLLEEKAVEEVGKIDDIVAQILADYSIIQLATQKIKRNRRLKSSEIVLLSVGSIVWLPLLISAIAVAFSLYASVWAILVSLWAVFGSFVATSIASLPFGIVYFVLGNLPVGLFIISASSVLAGLSIFTFFACKYLTALTLLVTKKVLTKIKSSLLKKECAQ